MSVFLKTIIRVLDEEQKKCPVAGHSVPCLKNNYSFQYLAQKTAKNCYFLKHCQIFLQGSAEFKEAITLVLILRLQGSAIKIHMIHWQTKRASTSTFQCKSLTTFHMEGVTLLLHNIIIYDEYNLSLYSRQYIFHFNGVKQFFLHFIWSALQNNFVVAIRSV